MPGGTMCDILVVGGGVIGLSIAWALRREGITVTVVEQGVVGGQATGAAAGMLAPLAEARVPGPFVTLGLESLRRYPALSAELMDETGIDIGFIGPGMLRVAMNDDEAYDLNLEFGWQKEVGLEVERLSAKETRLLEPSLAPEVRLAVRSSEERQVEPRRLVRALALACGHRGVNLIEGAPVIGFSHDRSRVETVQLPGQEIACGDVVIAGGAWSRIMADYLGAAIPIYPIRGQILSLQAIPPPFRHTLYSASGYLVPKSDGRIVVGATEDEAGFDARPTAGGMGYLLNMASYLAPALRAAVFETAWAGLRPASTDKLPILGRIPGWNNAFAACGHFRNGILLTPITAEALVREILTGEPDSLTEAFRPDRFHSLALAGEPR